MAGDGRVSQTLLIFEPLEDADQADQLLVEVLQILQADSGRATHQPINVSISQSTPKQVFKTRIIADTSLHNALDHIAKLNRLANRYRTRLTKVSGRPDWQDNKR